MPKLLVFAPCEKVIISQDENNPTLIATLSTVGGQFETPQPLNDKTAMAPMRWSIFSLWQKETGDEAKTLVQHLRFISPSGRRAIDGGQDFRMLAAIHRMSAHIGGIPVGENGVWRLELFMYESGQPIPKEPLASSPLEIQI